MKREGSQGQNKTFVLALKLAQFYFLKQTGGNRTPLLLLDDIFDKLLNNLSKYWIGTSKDYESLIYAFKRPYVSGIMVKSLRILYLY